MYWKSTWATCAKRLEVNNQPRLIHTVRGVGYILREE